MSQQQASLNRFMDEAAIRNVAARFADSATRADYNMFRACWADACEFTIGKAPKGHSVSGVDAAVSLLRTLRAGRDFFVQFALPGVIEINGDRATTRCFCHESARGPGETYYRNHSVAFDRLERSGDEWVFTNRSFQYLWLDTSPFTGNAFPLFPGSSAEQP
jgi:SnoaL-like domain